MTQGAIRWRGQYSDIKEDSKDILRTLLNNQTKSLRNIFKDKQATMVKNVFTPANLRYLSSVSIKSMSGKGSIGTNSPLKERNIFENIRVKDIMNFNQEALKNSIRTEDLEILLITDVKGILNAIKFKILVYFFSKLIRVFSLQMIGIMFFYCKLNSQIEVIIFSVSVVVFFMAFILENRCENSICMEITQKNYKTFVRIFFQNFMRFQR